MTNPGSFPNGMVQDDTKSNFTSISNQSSKTIKTSKTSKTAYFELNDDTDFLLLDLREASEFDKYHIKEGKRLLGDPLLIHLCSCQLPGTPFE